MKVQRNRISRWAKRGRNTSESRILAIADSFSSMTSARVYSPTLTYEAAINELKNGAGEQFDPKLVEVFLKIIPRIIAFPEQTIISG